MSRVDILLIPIARLQWGAFSRAQVLECGGNDQLIARRLRSGAWVKIHPGVYAMAGMPAAFELRVWAGHLALGPQSVLTHEVSLSVLGVTKVPRKPLTFTVAHGSHPHLSGVFAHQIDDLRPSDIITSPFGVPQSNAARALVEVAATLRRHHLGLVLDEAVVELQLTRYERVSGMVERLARPGKPGIIKMGKLLDDRIDGKRPHGSVSEKRLTDALKRHGMPLPERQVRLPGRGEIDGITDSCFGFEQLIIEVDSRRWHERIEKIAQDRARALHASKYLHDTTRIGYERIRSDVDEVCAEIAEVLIARRALFSSTGRTPAAPLAPIPDPADIRGNTSRQREVFPQDPAA